MSKPPGTPEELLPSPRSLLRTILTLDDTPHHVALGTAIGMFVGLTPTVGVQMLVVITLAFLTRRLFAFNRLAALLTVYVTNPVTTLPIYWFNYEVGTLFVDGQMSYDAFSAVFEYHNLATWWDAVCGLFVKIGSPLIVGSLIVATVVSIPTYPLMFWLVKKFHDATPDATSSDSSSSHETSDATNAPREARTVATAQEAVAGRT
ncbi:DUF2062 domain-containing protein [bacterium]|nr:DUF2062 domain-containing protein [bacterium]